MTTLTPHKKISTVVLHTDSPLRVQLLFLGMLFVIITIITSYSTNASSAAPWCRTTAILLLALSYGLRYEFIIDRQQEVFADKWALGRLSHTRVAATFSDIYCFTVTSEHTTNQQTEQYQSHGVAVKNDGSLIQVTPRFTDMSSKASEVVQQIAEELSIEYVKEERKKAVRTKTSHSGVEVQFIDIQR